MDMTLHYDELLAKIKTCVERAERHLESRETHNLYYACLDLRFALEIFARKHLMRCLKHISKEEIDVWQPKKVIEKLVDSVDSNLISHSFSRISGCNKETGEYWEYRGERKSFTPKDIGKYWNKLGRYLHVDHISKEPVLEGDDKIGRIVEESIRYIQKLCTYGEIDTYFLFDINFRCHNLDCGEIIVKSISSLGEDNIIECQNSRCNASYTLVKYQSGRYGIVPRICSLDCINEECDGKVGAFVNVFLKLSKTQGHYCVCKKCKTEQMVYWELLNTSLPKNANEMELKSVRQKYSRMKKQHQLR